MNWRNTIVILIILTLAGCGGSGQGTRRTAFEPLNPAPRQVANTQAPGQPRFADIGPLELQAAIMSFADTSNSRIAEVSSIVQAIGTPQARLTAARLMVFDVASNVEIAAGPYPGIALLDLIVVTSLRRMVWESFWVPRFGPEAEPALAHFREMEEDIWEAAGAVISAEQLNELAKIILEWRKKHPKQVSVTYVRFSDFGELGLKPSMSKLNKPGGLFASVKEATRVAQDMKVAIDRAFYLMSRMQLVMSFQIKLAYLEMMFQPEAEGFVDQTKQITSISERYAEIAEQLPEKLGSESSKLMDQLFAHIAINRDETITKSLAGLNQWQTQTISGVMDGVSKERQAAIDQAIQGLILQQNELYSRMDKLVDKSGSEFEKTLNHAFMLGLLFLLAFFVALTLYKIFVARPIDRKRG